MVGKKMIYGGYYIKARKTQESIISKQPPHIREIWDWLLMNANHADKKYKGFSIKRGQLFRSYKDIREGLAWCIGYRKMMYSENQTKKAMKFLRDNLMIETKKELGGVLITLLNYEFYQNPKNYERTSERPDESTNGEPMENQGIPDNNKNDKKDKKDKNEKKNIYSDETKIIIDYLNKIGNRNFKYVDCNMKFIKARLSEGYSVDDLKFVIDLKSNDEYFINNPKYLRPETLFNATKFQSYVNELDKPKRKISEKDKIFMEKLENL